MSAGGELLDRRDIDLTVNLPTHPYHHEGSWAVGRYLNSPWARPTTLTDAISLVGRVREAAAGGAKAHFESLATALSARITRIAIRLCPKLPTTTEERIFDTRSANVADSVMYREILAAAAAARGWSVHWYRRETVFNDASKVVGGKDLNAILRAMGQTVGPPWQAKQKLAATAAIAAGRARDDLKNTLIYNEVRMPKAIPTRRKSTSAKRRSALKPPRAAALPRNLLGDEIHEYSQAELTRLFGLPALVLHSLAKAGYITPAATEGKTTYSFQDLLVLRTAGALKAARISTAKITAALGHIRAALPPGSVLTTLALKATSEEQAAGGCALDWESKSRQYALPFSKPMSGTVTTLPRPMATASAQAQAEGHYAKGHALEESDVSAARAAYLDALSAYSGHLEARINLGRLLHLDGELQEAEKVYRQAISSSALLSFNLAILLEDLNREDEAIAAYRDALTQDPMLYDAHFNLSRLHERGKRPRDALRHLLAYRRHLTQHSA